MKQIHEDARGKIYQLKFGDREFLILETKKGFRRGGDYHKTWQFDVVLSGEVLFTYIDIHRNPKISTNVKKLQGEKVVFFPNEPHMLTALTDCLVLEWLEGPFEKQYYEPFKKLIKCEA